MEKLLKVNYLISYYSEPRWTYFAMITCNCITNDCMMVL